MATVVRVKRRRNEDPLEVLFLAPKRRKNQNTETASDDPPLNRNVFKFAGRVSSKDDRISGQVRDAIRKEKLEREYKQHHARIFGDAREESRQHSHQKSKQDRLKVTFKHRALELDSLDNVESNIQPRVCPKCGLLKNVEKHGNIETLKNDSASEGIDKKVGEGNKTVSFADESSGDISKTKDSANIMHENKENVLIKANDSITEIGQNKKSKHVACTVSNESSMCKCKDTANILSDSSCEKSKQSDKCSTGQGSSSNSSLPVPGSSGDGPVFCLVDMETEHDTIQPRVPSIADQITCNSEVMEREIVSERADDDYVYDIYYTNSREFDFRLFERDLTFEAFNNDFMMPRGGNDDIDDDFVYNDDNDDENAESNWRNDYPEEDPRIYEAEASAYDYENDLAEYEAFETETGDQLADWMSWRCNIDAGELSTDDDDDIIDHYDEKGSAYENYYKRVKKEMGVEDDDEDEIDIL
ncbi:hypothetical protein ACF0H5_005778 [Mactra antiquata]